jgi:hypothetical protein
MFYSPFKKFIIEEDNQLEAISHLPHVGELLYTGDPHKALAHLHATHQALKGKSVKGHNLSYKADGKMSIIFGKRNGNAYVKYKGKGSPELYSEQQIHDHINQTGKMHLLQPFLYGLKAAQHERIHHNHSYQGDVMVPDEESNHMRGNIIKYLKPRPSVSHAIAVHTHMETATGKKIGSNPDVSFLETSGSHFPNLSLNNRKFKIDHKESKEIDNNLSKAKELLSDPAVMTIAADIAQHRDPTNKLGHRHMHFVKFSNAVQRGTHSRDGASLVNWSREKEANSKGKEQQRLQAHADYIHRNRKHIEKLLQANNHIDHARSMMVDVIHRENNLPMTPNGGPVNGEGFVSELEDGSQVKLVPTSFTVRNNENKLRFKKVQRNEK